MAKAYRNFWALNQDEAFVAGYLRDYFNKKEVAVSFPLDSQLKDTDLFLNNIQNNKALKLQVKGSKAYEPKSHEIKKYHEGSPGWYFPSKKSIMKSTADYFIFLNPVINESMKRGRRFIEPHLIIIPTKKLQELCKEYKSPHGKSRFSFYFWINPKEKKAFDYRDKLYDLSSYLDDKGLKMLEKRIIGAKR